MSSLPIIVNRNGGTAAKLGDRLAPMLRAAFASAGIAVDIQLLDGKDMPDAIRRVAAHGRVIVAGGDGTVSCAAGQLAGSDTELGLLPLGTLNHLARDAGLPGGLDEAARVAATGRAVAIDVAEVNDHVFVNNASIGLYPVMVREREAIQDDRGWPKWLSMLPAGWAALRRLPHHRLTLTLDDDARQVVTPLLFVGNNTYSLDAGDVGQRETLTGGKLSVYAVSRRSRLGLLWFALRTIAGRAERHQDFELVGECVKLTVDAHAGTLQVALDGEVERLATPLAFRIRPGALRLVR